jgi:hypothetical protein
MVGPVDLITFVSSVSLLVAEPAMFLISNSAFGQVGQYYTFCTFCIMVVAEFCVEVSFRKKLDVSK